MWFLWFLVNAHCWSVADEHWTRKNIDESRVIRNHEAIIKIRSFLEDQSNDQRCAMGLKFDQGPRSFSCNDSGFRSKMNEHRQAISFANSYFALVDGLASGLENHLAEDVVLDWFGRTIRGRRNVFAFIEKHETYSRHIFSRIVAISGIEREPGASRTFPSQNENESQKKGTHFCNEERFVEESEVSPKYQIPKDFNSNEIDREEVNETEKPYDLCEGDLSNLFKLEIAPTCVEEIEQSINRIKLIEEVAPTIRANKKEHGQDGSDSEAEMLKHVEADGKIEFSRKIRKRDAWNSIGTFGVQKWKWPCKLQISYSILTEQPALETSRQQERVAICFKQPKPRLLSLDEVNEITNRLVPNENKFSGFLEDVSFLEDLKRMLKPLGTDLTVKDPETPPLPFKYSRKSLGFDKPCVYSPEQDNRKFVFNYQIHLIVYESTDKCRINLLSKFERTKSE